MNSIKEKFINNNALVTYITAGDPDIDTTGKSICALNKAGADIIVLGIPFSDPIAECEYIQKSNQRGLTSKTFVKDIFEMLSLIKDENISIVLYTYLNPLFKYGYEKFFKECKDLNIKGIMFADLPYEEQNEVSEYCVKYEIDIIRNINLFSKERIREITESATGFIGIFPQKDDTEAVKNVIKTIKEVNNIPVAVNTDFLSCKEINNADGIMCSVGIAQILEDYKDNASEEIYKYISCLKTSQTAKKQI